MITSIKLTDNGVKVLDQTKLPDDEIYLNLILLDDMIDAIKQLVVRGAPLIGVAAAYGMVLAARQFEKENNLTKQNLLDSNQKLKASRPTAVNLMWVCDQIKNIICQETSTKNLTELLTDFALHIHNDDRLRCEKMGINGSRLFDRPLQILTHCNTGFLATAGQGTALSVIYELHKKGLVKNVWVDETRPLLQGGRLTAWECEKLGIPFTGISDNMAASVIAQGKVDVIFTGADRIAVNGDTANKIGTLNLAVLAHHFKIPFYIVAPKSTFDVSMPTGKEIPIEERHSEEVLQYKGKTVFPVNTSVYNPAFDVTPNQLISGIITDGGVFYPPFNFKT